mmetsp:Transcript_2846/g.9999  ORF Transcript_2846/g.9999 Transcript_2846/m.9999 type:complete len:235 (-) Transcript_2846:78-782(-)
MPSCCVSCSSRFSRSAWPLLTTGPSVVVLSNGSPTFSCCSIFSCSACASAMSTSSCTSTLPTAQQFCPAFMKMPWKSCSAVSSIFASAQTIAGALPPSSNVQRRRGAHWSSGTATAACTWRPTKVLPVNATRSMLLFAAMASPISRPPGTTWKSLRDTLVAPFDVSTASTASSKRHWRAIAVRGVYSEGFRMRALPKAIAGATFQLAMSSGKLKGTMAPQTPTGSYWVNVSVSA